MGTVHTAPRGHAEEGARSQPIRIWRGWLRRLWLRYSQQVEEGFIVAQSFHQPYLHELRHLLPSLRVMYLSLSSATGMLEKENLQHVGLGFAGVAVRHSSLTASALKRLHLTQGHVFAWTVDAVDDIEAAVAIGVDGIITNYPDRAVAILAGSLPPRKRSSAAAVYSAGVTPTPTSMPSCLHGSGRRLCCSRRQ